MEIDPRPLYFPWLLLSLPVICYATTHDALAFGVYLILANVPMNLYAIFLQRDTRARLTRLLALAAEKAVR